MTDFYGIQTGTIPGFAEAGGGTFMSVQGLPDRTMTNMVTFMDKLRGLHAQDPLAFAAGPCDKPKRRDHPAGSGSAHALGGGTADATDGLRAWPASRRAS